MPRRGTIALAEAAVGLPFKRWTVLHVEPNVEYRKVSVWARCDCGSERSVDWYRLRSGKTSSCGCLKNEETVKRETTHGLSKTATYNSWCAMTQRCTNPKHPDYQAYAGRGIGICERWQAFANFLEDMGERPSGTSLERRVNSLGYSPGNCEWASHKAQARNTRRTRYIEHNGERMILSDWAVRLGVDTATLSNRLMRFPVEVALRQDFGQILKSAAGPEMDNLALGHACPRCKAKPTTPCVSVPRSGKVTGIQRPHRARRIAAAVAR